ncbi:hypothetical protein [Clostridium sp. JN-1]|jgi:hypothetical protein|uniref:hypothetical protein n=1 Tax=Clostridium sp. JN-1 TaxID=2483110 RepID=UPI000F0B6A70|nr:hypothetical protein [Clostridium sp. JN-1]
MTNLLIKFRHSEKIWINFCVVVFFGSLWGIVEATLGYLLHRMDLSVGWCIWFPLAFYFLDKIYRKTGEAWCVLYGGFIAAAIKLTDLFIEPNVIKVVNPAASIIFEAASLVLLYKIIEKKNKKIGILDIAGVNVAWRAIFLTYIFVFMPKSVILTSQLRALSPFLKFMLLESAANTIIIEAYIIAREKFSRKQVEKRKGGIVAKVTLSIAMFSFAIILHRFI